MIFVRFRTLCACLFAGLLVACGGSHVVVEGRFPTPLVEPLPIDIGLWFSDEFRSHEFSDEGTAKKGTSWVVQTGSAQVDMWESLTAGMFRSVTLITDDPEAAESVVDIDAILIPHIEELQYAIPAQTNIKVYEIWMRYRFELVTPQGEPLAEWDMTSYGKTPTAFLRTDEGAVNLAAVMALRDAGANFATSFHNVPAVRAWLREQGIEQAPGGAL